MVTQFIMREKITESNVENLKKRIEESQKKSVIGSDDFELPLVNKKFLSRDDGDLKSRRSWG